jgi:hypothetical protein
MVRTMAEVHVAGDQGNAVVDTALCDERVAEHGLQTPFDDQTSGLPRPAQIAFRYLKYSKGFDRHALIGSLWWPGQQFGQYDRRYN